MFFGILENGSFVFFWYLGAGSGGRGGESLRAAVILVGILTISNSASESLEDDEAEDESGEEDFLARSDKVALVSEPWFFVFFFGRDFVEDSLSELEGLDDRSESGNGIFFAIEVVEESESESEDEDEEEDESVSDELDDASTFFDFALSFPELDEEESESDEDLLGELDGSEDESTFAFVFAFFTCGASSSELKSDADDEELVDEALRFKVLPFGFGAEMLATGVSFSSSASLSDPLEDDVDGNLRVVCFLAGGESTISTSLSSSSLLVAPRILSQHDY